MPNQAKSRWTDWAATVAVLLCLAGLLLRPEQATQSARDGLTLCFNIIIPSLFPFFVLSTLLVQLGVAQALGRLLEPIMRPLFRVNGACGTALAMGFIGGYPVGARTALSLYENKLCGKEEAERMLAFCNNSGPAFIFGVVGVGVFASSRVGLLLYLAHVAASVTVGLVFRFYKRSARPMPAHTMSRPPLGLTTAFTQSVTTSFQSVLNICAFVVFFTVAIRMLFQFGLLPAVGESLGTLLEPIGFDSEQANHLLTGLIELTSGLWSLQSAGVSMNASLSMAAFMLGWAGISVHAQVLSFLSKSGLRSWTYIAGKLLHGMISAVYAYLLSLLFFKDISAVLVQQIAQLAGMRFEGTLLITLRVSLILSAVIVGGWLLMRLKRMHRRKYII